MIQCDGDRINTNGKIPYVAKTIWMDRNIPENFQYTFLDILDHADDIRSMVIHDLQNRQHETMER